MAGTENELGSTRLTLSEQLTADFYRWEAKCRGWQVWEAPVELEPPFEPFFRRPIRVPTLDDGRKPTRLSSLVERLRSRLFGVGTQEPSAPCTTEEEWEPLPQADEAEPELHEFGISLLPDQSVTTDIAEQLLVAIGNCGSAISYEILATAGRTRVQITCREPDSSQVRHQLRAYCPDIILAEDSDPLAAAWDRQRPTVIVEFGLEHEFMRPLRTFRKFEPDPLTGIVGAMEGLRQGELGLLQVLFQAAGYPWAESILRSVTHRDGRCFFADDPGMLALAREKVAKPLFAAGVRVVCQADSEDRAWQIARALGFGLRPLDNPQSNKLIPLENEGYDQDEHARDVLSRQTHRSGMLLNGGELVALVHLPSPSIRAAGLCRDFKRTKPPPPEASGHPFMLGDNTHQGKTLPVTLDLEQRFRHTYIVGATGTGKSTLLLKMIVQDLQDGTGVAVLDPHGDLIDRVLGHVPPERSEDVVLLDPSDSEYPVGLNILSAHTELERNVLASDLVAVFRRLSTSWGDQMTSVLGNAVLAFLESESGGTLLDLRRFLVEREFRQQFLRTVGDREVVYYWEKEYPLLTGKPQGPVLTRLDTFLRPRPIRAMVAQRECLDFQAIVDSRRIFLAKLAQGLIGEENAYLLGALIVSKLHQAAMARQATPEAERPPFFLYVDEFQDFITPSMASILSGARKYRFGLVLAHQELRQLWERDKELASSVISNPGTRVCFRLGDFDARRLADGFSFFRAQDLQNLGIGEAIARIERADHDFNLKVTPAPRVDPTLARERQEQLIELSRVKYGRQLPEPEPIVPHDEPQTTNAIPSPPVMTQPLPQTASLIPAKKKGRDSMRTRPEGKGGARHKYLQSLVKQMAEAAGYRAVIEQPTPDGSGSVDVGLEKDGRRVACEISVTSTDAQELGNIEKCLAAGYDEVVVCSPEKRALGRVQALARQKLGEADSRRLLFLLPDELFLYLKREVSGPVTQEQHVKGYRVRVEYRPPDKTAHKTARDTVAQVVVGSLRRMKTDTQAASPCSHLGGPRQDGA